MAERRMFSKRIICSARFIKMPVSCRELYFQLGLHADDDGVVEAYTVLNSVGATEDDLRVLVSKGFVVVLNEDLVSYITDWKENNKIRSDRKVDSMYMDLLVQVLPDIELQHKTLRADSKKAIGQPTDVQWTSNGRPTDGIGEDRLGKDSLGKVSKVKESKKPRHKYGTYGNVLLSDEDLEKLQSEFPKDWQERIDRVDEYCESTGKTYKSYLATIRAWAKKDKQKPKEPSPANKNSFRGNQVNNYDDIFELPDGITMADIDSWVENDRDTD